jgi:hypothetical protein
LEGGANSFSYTDSTLNPSGLENKPSALASIVQGGLVGGALGSGIDFLDGLTARRTGASVPPPGQPGTPPPTTGPATPRAATPTPAPRMQTTGYDPQRYPGLNPSQDLNFFDSPEMGEAVTNSVVHGGLKTGQQLTAAAQEALTSKPSRQLMVDRNTGERLPIWYSDIDKNYYTRRNGKVHIVPKDMLSKDRDMIRVIQNEQFMYPGEHRMVPDAARQALTVGSDTVFPIGFSPDMTQMSVVKYPLTQKGILHRTELMNLDDSIVHNGNPYKEALQAALDARKQARISKMFQPKMEEVPETDQLLDSLGAGLQTDLSALHASLRQRKRP